MDTKYYTIDNGEFDFVQNLTDLINAKQRASAARSIGTDPQAEKTRDVFLSSCAKLAEELASFGYKYAQSGPKCKIQRDKWTFEISFTSDHNNVAGEYVGLSICGTISHPGYLKWERAVGATNPAGMVSCGQIGYFSEGTLNLKWNLAKPAERNQTIAGALHAIKDLAFPYFERFLNTTSFRRDLQHGSIPMIDCHSAVDLLMWCGSPDEAANAAANYLKRNPHCIEEYNAEIARSSQRVPLAVSGGGFARTLAITVYFHQLEELVNGLLPAEFRGALRAIQ